MAHAATDTRTRTENMASQLMSDVHDVFRAGLGLVASTQEKTREVYDRLVDKGKSYENDEKKLLSRAAQEAKGLGQQLEQRIQNTVTATLNRAGVPSRNEIQELIRRLELLTKKVDELAKK